MSHHDETEEVDVDQRALVNILARYPGQFDVLRELIQNADDAEAPTVEVYFIRSDLAEGMQSNRGVKVTTELNVRKWIIKNEGSFKDVDWDRLGRIAAGNNDSTKVGAFGVGFYSVLSKSDRPLVKSNGKSLQFSKGEDGKLRKRFADCPWDTWTSVELELKAPEQLPPLDDLTRFLVSSVALLTSIHTISVHLDSQRLLHIQKESCGLPIDIPIPGHLKHTTPSETLTVETIQRTVQKITIDTVEWAFPSCSISPSSPVDPSEFLIDRSGRSMEDSSTPASGVETIQQEDVIIHDLYTAVTHVNLHSESEIKKGVEACLKSPPPSFKCKGVYFNSEQYASFAHINNSHSSKAHLFSGAQGIFPGDNSGRLFIGQSTNQTTGIGLHISAHFLPTVERGSIDLANGQIAAWNKEVLWISGFLARIIYEEEMRIAMSKDDRATQRGLCTMARFAFRSTAPDSGVSDILQEAFFSCCHKQKSPLPVVSDVGISLASDLQFRQGNKDLYFLKKYRVLHEDVESRQHSEIIKRYKIPLFKYGDIVREFSAGVTHETMKSFFAWWQDAKKNAVSPEARAAADTFCKEFASRAVLRPTNGVDIPLKNIKYFTFFPLPDDLSPPENFYIDVTSGVPTKDAVECFRWAQLPLLVWLKYASARVQWLTQNGDANAGRRISRVLVQFTLVEDLTATQWDQAADLIKDIECIPTNMGFKSPADSYFEEADICHNLPVVKETDFLDNIPTTSVAEAGGFRYRTATQEHVRKVLTSLRVRPTMEWVDLVERLESSASEESNDRLLQLLAGRREIMIQHAGDLRARRVFHSQNHGRLPATALHLPNEDIHRLGLPILALPRNSYISLVLSSPEPSISSGMVHFIESLGINGYPTLERIIDRAASDDPEVQRTALRYLLTHLDTRYDAYKPSDFARFAFIPTKGGSRARLNEVFVSPVWEKLGFKQPSEDLRDRDLLRLGVKEDPPIDTIIEYFKNPSQTLPDVNTATIWFEHLYLHGKLPVQELPGKLSEIPFVPVESSGPSSAIEYVYPKKCFIRSSDTKEYHRKVFPFVDFGEKGNSFLEFCCAKKSPDASDIVRKIVQDPQKYLTVLGNDTDLYLESLRTIASGFDSLSNEDKKAMQNAPMFLAFCEHVDGGKLLPAHRVVISDFESRDFGASVFLAPEEDVIEKFYHNMGSQFLGTNVSYDIEVENSLPNDEHALLANRDQIIQRIECFMRKRDKSEKTENISRFQRWVVNFQMRACKSVTMKKTFAPPGGVLAQETDTRTIQTVPIKVKAGFGSDESTLWVVKGSSASESPPDDIAMALCHVLLKTFGPNDILLLTSFIAMDEERFIRLYGTKKKSELSSAPIPKEKPRKRKVIEFPLPSRLAKVVGLIGIHPTTWKSFGQQVIVPEQDVRKAIELFYTSNSDSQPYDFCAPCRQHSPNIRKGNSHCKEAHKIKLKGEVELQDEDGDIRFFLAQNVRCRNPPRLALQKFSKLVTSLADVFGLEATRTCYIVWKDTDEDLMAFNRDQRFIFFNLAHYYKFFFEKNVEQNKVVTEWFLIMAHEIAHNMTLDHDEYHGSLSSRIAVDYLPALHKHPNFDCFVGDAQSPQSA